MLRMIFPHCTHTTPPYLARQQSFEDSWERSSDTLASLFGHCWSVVSARDHETLLAPVVHEGFA